MHELVAVGCRRRAVFSIAEEMVLICSVWPATSLPRSMKISLTSLTVVCPGAGGGSTRWAAGGAGVCVGTSGPRSA